MDRVLTFAQFTKVQYSPNWRRGFPKGAHYTVGEVDFVEEEEREIWIRHEAGMVEIHLSPGIGAHTSYDHARAAYPASVAFMLANELAKLSGGRVQQSLLRGLCRDEQSSENRWLADYGDQPLEFKYDHLCAGFRQALFHGIHMELPTW